MILHLSFGFCFAFFLNLPLTFLTDYIIEQSKNYIKSIYDMNLLFAVYIDCISTECKKYYVKLFLYENNLKIILY